MIGVFNKASLLTLLRKHPSWNEDTLSVKFDVSAVRNLDVGVIRDKARALLLAAHDSVEVCRYDDFYSAVLLLADTSEQFLPAWFNDEAFYKTYGVEVKKGQKTSRALNKVCREFGATLAESFNHRFAELADALNPINIPRTASLSIHPCDYLEMSNVDNSWSSCHNLDDGCYRAGTLSYLLDSVSMIFSTVEKEHIQPLYKAPKVTREVFCYGDGVLLQSRLYPDYTDRDTIKQYRALVQSIIASCEGVPNLWHTTHDVNNFYGKIETCCGSLHYTDYTYPDYNPSLSTLDSMDTTSSYISIGAVPKCLYCSQDIIESGQLLCDACHGGYICAECGCSLSEDDGHYVDGYLYCDDCVSYCDWCNEYTREELCTVYTSTGNARHWCPECANEHALCCDKCGDYYLLDALTEHEGMRLCPECLKDATSAEEVAS